ncbi:hypothetical protein [Bacteroides sp.]|uniref:hypothetical protein n=1 Tax=Bacteroides sp. TaxID=29523 RepID=UPI00262623C5|nr:hypothetical protein [Bacteroides sp.]MDD3039574.1 hypothetical protein [Bacteroides sp.]
MIPEEYKILLRNSLPSVTIDGRNITRVLESFSLNEYVNPVLGINFLDEWREYYNSIDQYRSLIQATDDDGNLLWDDEAETIPVYETNKFQFSKYYSTRVRFTVVADDVTTSTDVVIPIVEDTLEYEIEPLIQINSISSEVDYTVNTTNTGIIFATLPTEQTVTVNYSYISRGYTVAHSIMQQAIEWMELYFGDIFKPINGFIVDRGSVTDISRIVGSDLLTVISYDCTVACKTTFIKVLSDDEFIPVKQVIVRINEETTIIE